MYKISEDTKKISEKIRYIVVQSFQKLRTPKAGSTYGLGVETERGGMKAGRAARNFKRGTRDKRSIFRKKN